MKEGEQYQTAALEDDPNKDIVSTRLVAGRDCFGNESTDDLEYIRREYLSRYASRGYTEVELEPRLEYYGREGYIPRGSFWVFMRKGEVSAEIQESDTHDRKEAA